MLVSRNIWTGEAYKAGSYYAFVYAYGGVRHDPLSAALKERGVKAELIRDAFSPRSLQHAILEGHSFDREL